MHQFDYRHFLHEELVSRCKRNPAYSARAMARDLDLSTAFLSQILSGKRILSEERAHIISESFPWAGWKKKVFLKLVRYHSVQNSELGNDILKEVKILLERARAKSMKAKMYRLRLEEFKIIADWYHMAIYELTSLKCFKEDPAWIALKLGISSREANLAIRRLLQVGLLERVDGKLRRARGDCKMGATPSLAIRSFHHQQLAKATVALANQDRDVRDFTGTTFAIDLKKLPKAKALIRRFNEDLMQFFESDEPNAVYHLAVQLYRLDQPEKE